MDSAETSSEMMEDSDQRSSACFWSCFRQPFRKESMQEQKQLYMPVARARNAGFDPETERRIMQWILESSLCYGHASESSEDTGLDGEHSNNTRLHLTKLALDAEPAKNSERNRNRWKGRLPASNTAEPHITSLSTKESVQESVQIKLQEPPQHLSRPTTQSDPAPCPAARVIRSERVIWMRRSRVLYASRTSARVAAQPMPPAIDESGMRLPVSCASKLA